MALLRRGKPLDRDSPALSPSRAIGTEVPLLPGDVVSHVPTVEVLSQGLGAQLVLVSLYLRWGKVEWPAEEAVPQSFGFKEGRLNYHPIDAGEPVGGGDGYVERDI